MATVTSPTATLKDMSLDQLADLLDVADDAERAAIMAECRRRDRADAQRRRTQAVAAEWFEIAFGQYLAAEAECNGYLLSREGLDAGIDPIRLWSIQESRAMRLASEELRNFWLANPRLTLAEYRRQRSAEARVEREVRREARRAPRRCKCGCMQLVTRSFVPGHDSLLAQKFLTRFRAGAISEAEVLVAAEGVSDRFVGKMARLVAA